MQPKNGHGHTAILKCELGVPWQTKKDFHYLIGFYSLVL